MEQQQHHHRASAKLKQANKAHKSYVKSKRQLMDVRGRTLSASSSGGARASAEGKDARHLRAEMQRKAKREELVGARRELEESPKVVFVVGLERRANAATVWNWTRGVASRHDDERDRDGKPTVEFQHFKDDRLSVNYITSCSPERDPLETLDACKVADVVVFVLPVGIAATASASAHEDKLAPYLANSIDERGRELLTLIKAQGLPTCVGVVQGLTENVPPKLRNAVKKNAALWFQEEIGKDVKTFVMEERGERGAVEEEEEEGNDDDDQGGMEIVAHPSSSVATMTPTTSSRGVTSAKLFVRALAALIPKALSWKIGRAMMLVERVDEKGGLWGYLQNAPMKKLGTDLDPLAVHLPGVGTFAIAQVSKEMSLKERLRGGRGSAMTVVDEPVVMYEGGGDVREEAVPNLLGADEQTWPTSDELREARDDGEKKKTKGEEEEEEEEPDEGEEYLAAWGMPREEGDGSEGKTKKNATRGRRRSRGGSQEDVEEDDDDEMVMDGKDEEEDDDKGIAHPIKLEKSARARLDMEFPDEMDTPSDVPARERFAKYRGLKSFRTSPWHPTESLPREYAYIHQIKNSAALQKAVFKALEEEEDKMGGELLGGARLVAKKGSFVRVLLAGLSPQTLYARTGPLVLGTLLPHEHKLSVVNCLVQPASGADTTASREPLELHCGLWRRAVRPVFSEHVPGADKFKMERYLQPGRWSVASAYAPVTLGVNVPTILFRGNELVATGHLHSVDASRIVLKKVVLTGHPFRVKKRWAVVRRMFHDPRDVDWFSPCELYTKYGASGRILESVGTHGRMKCLFDRVITQQDTICLALYKRVFPKPGSIDMFKALREEQEEDDDV